MKASMIAGFTPEAKSRQEQVKKLKMISDRLVKLSGEFDSMLNASSMQFALGNASNGAKKFIDASSSELEMMRKMILENRAAQIQELLKKLDVKITQGEPEGE